MWQRSICVFLIGGFVLATATEFSNDLWSMRGITVDANEEELEKQFDSDWNDLQDPLDWMNNVIETDFDDLPNEAETEVYDEDTNDNDAREEINKPTLPNDEETSEKEYSEESVSTPEEYGSDEESDGISEFEDSSEETSQEEFHDNSNDTESYDINNRRRFGWAKRYGDSKGKRNHRRTFKKRWPNRRDEIADRYRRFRNPHGARVQKPHPPPIGRWQKVWQRFNQSKPAQAGRWAAMYNRTQGYWNRVRNRLAKRVQIRENILNQSNSEDAQHNTTNENHSYHWRPHNHTHHWHPHNHTHHWHPHNQTDRHKGHGRRPHGREHRRFGPEYRPNRGHDHGKSGPRRRWLEDKATHVCNYLSSPRHGRYMQFIRTKQQRRVGNTEKRDYRIDFVEQMSHCCQQDYEEKLECFGNLTRARIDEFCRSDSNMPFRPWKPGQNPRAVRKIKPKCCLPEGEARYNCFNRTHQVLQHQRYRVIRQDSKSEEEPQTQDRQVPAVTSTKLVSKQKRRNMKRKQHRLTPKQNIKTRCCSLGKSYGAEVEDRDRATVVCNKLARKLSHKFKNKLICHMALGRCCINEARKQSHVKTDVTLDPDMEQELDAIEEMSLQEDSEERQLEFTEE